MGVHAGSKSGERNMSVTSKSSIKIALVVGLIAALTFIVGASIVATIMTEVQAVKGEAAFHISPQGRAHQSAQGAAASGTGCQVLC